MEIIHPMMIYLCPMMMGIVIGCFFLVICIALHDGMARLKRLHQIPCSHCAFFTGDYRLKCAVHPCKALSEDAIDCLDYEPTSNPWSHEAEIVRDNHKTICLKGSCDVAKVATFFRYEIAHLQFHSVTQDHLTQDSVTQDHLTSIDSRTKSITKSRNINQCGRPRKSKTSPCAENPKVS